MSNRVKVPCKDYEERIAKAKTAADKEQRKQEMIAELQSMGIVVQPGKGVPPGRGLKGRTPGAEPPAKKSRSSSPALADLPDDDEEHSDPDEPAITSINHKEAYLSVETIEKIASKHDVNVKLGKDKDAPMSRSEAADAIILANGFSRKKWLEARQKIFGLAASSAGSKLQEAAIVSSTLSGYLGKYANKL